MNKNMTKWVADMIAEPKKKAFPVLSFPAIRVSIAMASLPRSSLPQACGEMFKTICFP